MAASTAKLKATAPSIFNADRDKGKCNLHGGTRQVLVEYKGQSQAEIELNDDDSLF
jgi:hypothetical protein